MDNNYSICLCYTEEKGLFVERLSEGEGEDIVLLRSHNEEWKRTNKASIPGTDTIIQIHTKIGSCYNSFFYATIRNGENIVLDFDESKLQILNGGGVERITAHVGDWIGLFQKIIERYNESLSGQCPLSSIEYIEGIENILDKDRISIHGQFNDERTRLWQGKYIVLVYAASKITNLLSQLPQAHITDEAFHHKCLSLCHNFLDKLAELDIDLGDSRLFHLSNALWAIHSYMYDQQKGEEFLKYYLNKQ